MQRWSILAFFALLAAACGPTGSSSQKVGSLVVSRTATSTAGGGTSGTQTGGAGAVEPGEGNEPGDANEGAENEGADECHGCTSDGQCGGAGSGCWLYDESEGASHCATDCSTSAATCPQGTTCLTSDAGVGTCVPAAGTCSGWGGGTSGSSGTGSGGTGTGAGTGTGTGTGTGSGTTACSAMTDTWSSYAQGFFSASCSSCHSWATSYSGVAGRSGTISSYVGSGFMPQGSSLSAADKARILAWITCGMPQ